MQTGTYQIAVGYNGTPGLTPLIVQPQMGGIGDGLRRLRGDGILVQDGFSTAVLGFGYLTPDQYEGLLTQMGLMGGTVSARVTVTLPTGPQREFESYNAIIVRPVEPDQARYEATVWQEIQFELKRLVNLE